MGGLQSWGLCLNPSFVTAWLWGLGQSTLCPNEFLHKGGMMMMVVGKDLRRIYLKCLGFIQFLGDVGSSYSDVGSS